MLVCVCVFCLLGSALPVKFLTACSGGAFGFCGSVYVAWMFVLCGSVCALRVFVYPGGVRVLWEYVLCGGVCFVGRFIL